MNLIYRPVRLKQRGYGKMIVMSQTLLKTALRLSKAERILLAEKLWDSIADDQGASIQLTAAQEEELMRRLQRLKKTGALGSDWPSTKERIIKQYGQTPDR